ncbi:MAG: zinc ABC transporter substrate-binding protein [Candidatus Eremiobacteraeota bacterium]|uniref:Putative Periplasmic solute binding protein n=1 Tax=mine drainage metagenome TaxID=410659 RepID=E6Q3E1_9ZZZZ|nr:metal ABC transporter substrate-binding protein [Candidatus Eremiobacteraeota bacterium]NNM91813.1 zinc ABC transporter substrate-binding protein [Candidatus Eremiobacteraeota bacterium]
MRIVPRALALLALLAVAACSGQKAPTASPSPSGAARIDVVTTFSTLNSFVNGVGGRYVRATNIVPVGASPETFQPTPQSIAVLNGAQLVVENGTGIDAWVDRMVRGADVPRSRVLVITDGMPVVGGNPHLWMDPVLAKTYVAKILAALVRIDPAHESAFKKNAIAYDAKLDALTAWIRSQVATIPPARRQLIVFHDAWPYFAKRFGIHIVGSLVPAPGQEPNPRRLAQLVTLARKLHVRAVFAEPEYSAKLANAFAGSADIHVVTDLYDDSIGHRAVVHDYLSMMRYNTEQLVRALK